MLAKFVGNVYYKPDELITLAVIIYVCNPLSFKFDDGVRLAARTDFDPLCTHQGWDDDLAAKSGINHGEVMIVKDVFSVPVEFWVGLYIYPDYQVAIDAVRHLVALIGDGIVSRIDSWRNFKCNCLAAFSASLSPAFVARGFNL